MTEAQEGTGGGVATSLPRVSLPCLLRRPAVTVPARRGHGHAAELLWRAGTTIDGIAHLPTRTTRRHHSLSLIGVSRVAARSLHTDDWLLGLRGYPLSLTALREARQGRVVQRPASPLPGNVKAGTYSLVSTQPAPAPIKRLPQKEGCLEVWPRCVNRPSPPSSSTGMGSPVAGIGFLLWRHAARRRSAPRHPACSATSLPALRRPPSMTGKAMTAAEWSGAGN